MKSLLSALFIAAAALFAGPTAYAIPLTFEADLNSANENNPLNHSTGTGTAFVIIDPALNTMRVEVTFSGLTAPTSASHIHCCEATPGANANIIVATTVPTFPGFPLGVTAGSYDQTFDLTLATSYNPDFVAAHGGTVGGAEAALIDGIEHVEAYLNIHTSLIVGGQQLGFPTGEIRGLLVAAPEPSSLILLGSAAVLALGLIRRRRMKPVT